MDRRPGGPESADIFGNYTDLPDVGTLTFTNSQVDGKPLGDADPEGFDLARFDNTMATTGPLTNGTDFTETWKANF